MFLEKHFSEQKWVYDTKICLYNLSETNPLYQPLMPHEYVALLEWYTAQKSKCFEQNQPQCHFKHHKVNMVCLGTGPVYLWWEAVTNHLSHGMVKLSPKYWIALTPLLDKNQIMHFSDFLYCVTLSPHTSIALSLLASARHHNMFHSTSHLHLHSTFIICIYLFIILRLQLSPKCQTQFPKNWY